MHCPSTCANLISPESCSEPDNCESGCKCKNGTVLNDRDECVKPSECECNIDGNIYKPGSVIQTGNPCIEW